MADSYLTLARKILKARARPLTATQILLDASEHSLLPEHLSGDTMQKTLQARIAEDIYIHRERSLFYRTGLGTYFLREFKADASLPARARREFDPPARGRPLPRCRVLHLGDLPPSDGLTLLRGPAANAAQLATSSYSFIGDASPNEYKVVTFTVVTWLDYLFSYTVGKHSYLYDIIGLTSIGLVRYVDEFDMDLLSDDDEGALLSAIREYSRIVGAASSPSPRSHSHHAATIIDPVRRQVALVILTSIDDAGYAGEFRRRLDVRRPRWVHPEEVGGPIEPYSATVLEWLATG